MGKRANIFNKLLLACDFETTVWTKQMLQEAGVEEQPQTEVWSAAIAQLYSDYVNVDHTIEDFFNTLFRLCNENHKSIIAWFHNLRFDGMFIAYHLLTHGWQYNNVKTKDMGSREFKALISDQNRWYSLTLKYRRYTIEIRDSLKLMPFSLAQIGPAFKTKHRKLEMEYAGYRFAGCEIKPDEMAYIVNDVLVLKEALETMLNDGHTNLTIGSCCVDEYKKLIDPFTYKAWFTDLKKIELPDGFGYTNADAYIRQSYHGAWCYLNKANTDKNGRTGPGRTFDVNSLYPSVMHSDSGNFYPVGEPVFFKGAPPPQVWLDGKQRDGYIVFTRVKVKFELRPGYFPTVQIKRNFLYDPTAWLESSDPLIKGKKYKVFMGENGNKEYYMPELTLTYPDYLLLTTHYNILHMEFLDGCYFRSEIGIFDTYIDKWQKIKQTSKGALRTEAKLYCNNLYGKLATGDNSSYRVPTLSLTDDKVVLPVVKENEKAVWDIAKGAMVTAYARYFEITHAQLNHDLFVYADTDSLHLLEGKVKGVNVHPTKLLHWKEESHWRAGIFLRQKTYAEFIDVEDGEKVYPHWNITCAGMSDRCKKAFLATHPITDFKYGLKVPGKLVPKAVKGGVILKEKEYTLRKK